MIKSSKLFFSLLIISIGLNAQPHAKIKAYKTKNYLWFTPNEAKTINGLAVGFQAMNINSDSLTINGLNAGIGLASMMVVPYVIIWELKKKKNKSPLLGEIDTALTIIKGVSISMGGEINVSIHGVNIAGGVTFADALNGLSLTGVFTRCNVFRGVSIAGLHNIAIKGRGLQIGLFNNCKDLKGIQLGLWNKSGKRGLPFINWGT